MDPNDTSTRPASTNDEQDATQNPAQQEVTVNFSQDAQGNITGQKPTSETSGPSGQSELPSLASEESTHNFASTTPPSPVQPPSEPTGSSGPVNPADLNGANKSPGALTPEPTNNPLGGGPVTPSNDPISTNPPQANAFGTTPADHFASQDVPPVSAVPVPKSDKKTIIILGAVAVVLIAAIVILFFVK